MKAWLRGAMWRLIFATMIVGAGAIYSVANNFTLTQGAGTTFASLLISTINYPIHLLCDATAGETQCQAVNSSGQASVLEANSGSILTAVQSAIPPGPNSIGNVGNIFPIGATPTFGSATSTNAAILTATLAAVASVTQNVCWISVRANATAATNTFASLTDGTKTYNFLEWVAPNASGVGIAEEIFNPCIPASATNTPWTLTGGNPTTGGQQSVTIGGWEK